MRTQYLFGLRASKIGKYISGGGLAVVGFNFLVPILGGDPAARKHLDPRR